MKKLVAKVVTKGYGKGEEEREKVIQLVMELFRGGVLTADDFIKVGLGN